MLQFQSYKLVKMFLHYPLVILLLILALSLTTIFPLRFSRANAITYFTLFLALYLIHTCLSPFIPLFFFRELILYSQVCIRSHFYPYWKDAMKEEMMSPKKEWNLESCCSSPRKEDSWMTVDLHYEAKSRWVLSSFEALFSFQRLFSGI